MQQQSFQIRFMANIYEMVPGVAFKNDFLRIKVKITEITAINRNNGVIHRHDLYLCFPNYWYSVEILMINIFFISHK